jgi:hypothetical protein
MRRSGADVRRVALFNFTMLAMLVVAQGRLSRGDPNRSEPEPPALWQNSQPPGRWVTQQTAAANCALLIATDPGNPYALTSVEAGVRFDIDADGTPDRTAWTESDSEVAFLALDQDGDGGINTGKELVGDRTVPTMPNGLRALSQLTDPTSQRATVDADVPLLANLLLWRDKNHNGTSEPGELRPAQDEIAAIGLGYQRHRRIDAHGNQSRYRGYVHIRTAAGPNRATTPDDDRARRRYIYEVCFVTGE